MESTKEAMKDLKSYWTDDADNVIAACIETVPFNDSFDEFLNHCTACGGNWGGMLLTGIKKLFPKVYDAIPDNMGKFAFAALISTLKLCGVIFEED